MDQYRKELSMEERERKIKEAEEKYSGFMDVILPGWRNDPNSKDTAHRVAKMYVNELLDGYYGPEPKITAFPNVNEYTGIVFQGNIDVRSMCSHHHAFFFGSCNIAYLPKKDGNIIGLSKLNRIVNFYARRVQVQENLCQQILEAIEKHVGPNQGVAVHIKAKHTCVSHRGVNQASEMQTTRLSGVFLDSTNSAREEFYQMTSNLSK